VHKCLNTERDIPLKLRVFVQRQGGAGITPMTRNTFDPRNTTSDPDGYSSGGRGSDAAASCDFRRRVTPLRGLYGIAGALFIVGAISASVVTTGLAADATAPAGAASVTTTPAGTAAAPAASAGPAELSIGEPITPVPLTDDLDPRKVKLGRRMFTDSRLSGDHGVSCASCHNFNRAFTDGLPISAGLPGNPGVTNTLSLLNVDLNSKHAWDGHVMTLQEQAAGVVVKKSTMGANWDNVIATLKSDTAVTAAFKNIYPDGVRKENVIDALVEFEKSLNTPNAPFDRYLRGDDKAITDAAKAGYQLFKDYGCASCHQGVNVGGNMVEVFGIFGKPRAASKGAETPGSAQNTGISDDRPVFRVPSLRNVQFTGPYFHDGSVPTLSKAIAIMARYQLGRNISDDDVANIEAFLDSLTGEYRGVPVGKL
jgi:cytochrome c peroxidase